MKNKFLCMIISFIMIMTLASCDASTNQMSPSPSPSSANSEINKDNAVNIEIEMQDGGIIKAELYPEVAPITVANFVKLCEEGFYDGLIFHRIIPGFMIQGGGYDTSNTEKETMAIKGEFAINGVENNMSHERGVLSMARTNVPDSASSQFFIMHDAAPHLDGQYAAFGMVTEGMNIVDAIATTETSSTTVLIDDQPVRFDNYPTKPQVIKTIRVVEPKAE